MPHHQSNYNLGMLSKCHEEAWSDQVHTRWASGFHKLSRNEKYCISCHHTPAGNVTALGKISGLNLRLCLSLHGADHQRPCWK